MNAKYHYTIYIPLKFQKFYFKWDAVTGDILASDINGIDLELKQYLYKPGAEVKSPNSESCLIQCSHPDLLLTNVFLLYVST